MSEYINGTTDILGGSVIRYALNTTTPNQAVIRKIIAGNGISISYTGVDAGTGDVTISINTGATGGSGSSESGGTSSGGQTTGSVGTVTSVNMTVPVGMSILGAPITTAGTLALKLSSGYSIPLITDVSKGIEAYDKTVSSLVYNTTNGAVTLVRKDGSTIVASITLNPFTTTNLVEGSNLYYTDARARAAISETITGIDYSSSTGVFSLTSGYIIPTTTQATNWDTAYGWGNHALAGYQDAITLTTVGNAGVATFIDNTLNIPSYSAVSNGLVSGGIVSWSGSGFVYDVSAASYFINSSYYSTVNTQITLSAADPTNDRLDIVAVDSSNTVVVIAGVPGANPVKAQIDPTTQIELTTILVPAGATGPVNIISSMVYDEISNANYTNSATGVTVNFANTSTPYTGTVSASVTATTTGTRYIDFTRGTVDSVASYSVFKFAIRLGASWASNSTLAISFYNGTTQVSSEISVLSNTFGFVRTTINTYQLIQINIRDFRFTSASFNKIRFRFLNSLPAFIVDRVELQAGVTQTILQSNNIYTTDGSLVGIRKLTLNANSLTFEGSTSSTVFSSTGAVSFGGAVTLGQLTGTGNRLVAVDSTGLTSAVIIGSGLLLSAGTLTATLSSGSFVSDYDSAITGLRNSSNTVYTLTQNYQSGTTKVYVNGVRYSPGAGNDYTESAANQITFTNAPDSGDLILVDYIKS